MIPLRFPFAADAPHHGSKILKLRDRSGGARAETNSDDDVSESYAELVGSFGDMSHFLWRDTYIAIEGVNHRDLLGDICRFNFDKGYADRWIRSGSGHNTLVVTERCDQLCVMCSQPPKKSHDDLFVEFEEACLLAEVGKVIGISGGEPTLYKAQLFSLLMRMQSRRPDIHFHVLTNGQHFDEGDRETLAQLRDTVLWAVPLYARTPSLHDKLVGKAGAFERLMKSFVIFAQAGADIELRTVVMQQNAAELPRLAQLITARLPFIRHWAIMQLENIGFARNRWSELFFDHSVDFEPVQAAAAQTLTRGIDTVLFNFPLCTLPKEWRSYAPPTISDWKRRFIDACNDCPVREQCSGLFEWHPDNRSYQRMGGLEWRSDDS